MASHASVSERTFHRRFAERTGVSPLTWLTEQRIARAKELLETTDLSVQFTFAGHWEEPSRSEART